MVLFPRDMEPTASDQAKARRAIRLIYLAMVVGILLPVVLFWLLR